jgi:hypothetical protein
MEIAETLTTFLRDPNSLIDRVEKGDDVILRRRDGAALRLSLKSHWEAEAKGTDLVARLLVELLRLPNSRDIVARALQEHFPWIRFLPEGQTREFLDEFLATTRACAEVHNNQPLAEVISAWKSTAAIYADPSLVAELRRSLPGTDDVVPAPPRPPTESGSR